MSTPEEVFAAADALSPDDKWLLVTRLWASLPTKASDAPSDAELAEVQRRSAEFDAGGVEAIGRDEVRRRIHDRLAGHG